MKKRIIGLGAFLLTAGAASAARVETVQIPSPSMKREIPATVVLPDGYADSNRLYPVVYMLHGAGGSHATYPELEVVRRQADRDGLVVVCPDGGKTGWWLDSPEDPAFRYETHVVREVLPFVERRYRIAADKAHRAIAGGSMGGHGAAYIAIRHRELFGSLGIVFGGVDLRPFPNGWDIAKRLGRLSDYPDRWRANSVVTLAEGLKDGELDIYSIVGTSDFFLKVNRDLHETLTRNGVRHTYVEYRGGDEAHSSHSREFAVIAYERVLSRFAARFALAGWLGEPVKIRCESRIGREGYGAYNWWLERLNERRRLVRESGGVFDVVFLGDSITHNFGPRPEKPETAPGEASWRLLTNEFSVLNCGYSGDGYQHVLWRIRNGELDGVEAKCFMLLVGTNNAGNAPSETAAGICAILNELKLRQPQAKILLLAVFPRGADEKDYARGKNRQVNALIRSFADGDRVFWVDLWDRFLDEKGDTRWIMPDRLHPNGDGYARVWLPAVLPHFREFCRESPPKPAFELSLRQTPTNAPVSVTAGDAVRWSRQGGLTQFFFGENAPVKSVGAYACADTNGFTRYCMDVDVADGWHLERTAYPLIDVPFPLVGDGVGDRCVVGATVGGVWHPKNIAVGRAVVYPYPGSLAAQFAAVYNASNGWYFAAEDAAGHEKGLGFKRLEHANRFVHERRGWDAGVVTGAYDVAVRRVDRVDGSLAWEDFADVYRVWLNAQPWMRTPYLERTDVPGWMKRAPAMTRYSRQWLAEPEKIAASVGWWRRTFGSNDVVAAVWGWEKIGTWWGPDYFPAFPDDGTIRAENAFMKENGFHPFAWPSCYNWSECIGRRADGSYRYDYRQTCLKDFEDVRCVTREGVFHRSPAPWMDNGANAAICGGAQKAREWLRTLTAELADRGFDMVQFDQSPGGRLNECWSAAHGHPAGMGKWNFSAFMDSLRALQDGLKGVCPAGVICVEQPHEQFTGLAHLQDYRDLEFWCEEPAGVYAYLHHGYMPMFQSNPYRDNLYAVAYMAVEGQVPFFRLLDEDLQGKRPLLKNGGFETRTDNARMGALCWEVLGERWLSSVEDRNAPVWNFDGAGNWNGRGDWNDRHGGAVSYRMKGGACAEQCGQTLRDVPEGEYVLSAYVKTDRLDGVGALLWGDKDGEKGRVPFPAAGSGWRKISAKIKAGGKLRVILYAGKGVEARVDDVSLEHLDGTPVFEQGESVYLRMMKSWIRLYQGEGRPFLAYGFREKPPKLECARFTLADRVLPSVLCAAYRSADGTRALAVANATDRRQPFNCVWRGKPVARTLEPTEIALIAE